MFLERQLQNEATWQLRRSAVLWRGSNILDKFEVSDSISVVVSINSLVCNEQRFKIACECWSATLCADLENSTFTMSIAELPESHISRAPSEALINVMIR